MNIDDLISALQGLKGSGRWNRLAEVSGVNYFTIARIARGAIKSPGLLTAQRLAAAIPAVRAEPPPRDQQSPLTTAAEQEVQRG